MNLPSILFKCLRELVKETRNGSTKAKKWIPMGRLIFGVLFERKLVQTLLELCLTKEVDRNVGKVFNGRNLKNVSLISTVTDPSEVLDKNTIAYRRIRVGDFPLFTKEDPSEILEAYIADYLAISITLVAYSYYELPDHPVDVLSLKRKRKYNKMGDGPFGIIKSPSKVAKTSRVLKRP